MKIRTLMLVLLVSAESMTLATAQSSREPMSRGESFPRLGDIMLAKQWRHIKLWFAGRQRNWDLAAYELAQLKASLADAATLYSNIPVSDVAIMVEPLQSINRAIEAKDSKSFGTAFNGLTAACNSCHREMGREFITIQVPAVSPFSDQSFSPSKK
jgi:cytochrome c553